MYLSSLITIMAINTNNNHRTGPVKNRTQCFNSKTNQFIKRDETGKFVSAKTTPYKGVTKEDSAKKAVTKDKKSS